MIESVNQWFCTVSNETKTMNLNWAKPSPTNPGKETEFSFDYIDYKNELDTIWVELIGLTEAILKDEGLPGHGYEPSEQEDCVLLNENIAIIVLLVENVKTDETNFKTTISIEVKHREKELNNIFEVHQEQGDDPEASAIEGIEKWVRNDLGVILDALNHTNQFTAHLRLDSDTREPRAIVTGPILHKAEKPPIKDEEPFTERSFTMNLLKPLKPLLDEHTFYALRFFVAKNREGEVEANCRLNGADFEEGRKALLEYAKTWPSRGFELRRQFVVITDWV